MARLLIVLTSHADLGGKRPTGFYYEELATPYWAFVDAGHQVELASIAGGEPPCDPSSLSQNEAERPADVRRFLANPEAMDQLRGTKPVASLDPASYDAVFLPGGHGTMWDLPRNEALARLIGAVFDRGGVIGAVCHGPAGLLTAKRSDGRSILTGKRVNGFTNGEEEAAGLTGVVPFLLETRMREQGGLFECGPNFTPYAVRDGTLVTGQNPMSSAKVSALINEALAEDAARAA